MIRSLVLTLAMASPALAELPLPFNLGGEYQLTDQHGQRYTQADPNGKPQLLFFGYVNCQEICSAVFPMMAEVVDTVKDRGIDVTPVLITVDPSRDTVETMAEPLASFHPDFVGLTGSKAELQIAYDAYSIEKEEVFFDPEYGPVYAHGSFVYLLDADGKFLTLVPPILGPDQAATIIEKYVGDLG